MDEVDSGIRIRTTIDGKRYYTYVSNEGIDNCVTGPRENTDEHEETVMDLSNSLIKE